jgi:hypothetical protein
VTAIKTVRGIDEPHPKVELHAPETDDEYAAARVGLDYALATQRRDPAAACRFTADPLARELRCATRPRFRLCRGERVYHAKEDDDVVDVRLDECHLKVARRDGAWRVIEEVPQVGYA